VEAFYQILFDKATHFF